MPRTCTADSATARHGARGAHGIWAALCVGSVLAGCTGDELVEHAAVDDESVADTEAAAPCAEASSEARSLYWQVWEQLDASYPYFDYKDIDWAALGAECEAHVCLEGAGYNAFVGDAMECLLSPLADYHVAILDRRGFGYQYGVPRGAPNSDEALTASLLDPGSASETTYTLSGTLMEGRFGYIRVDTWNRSALDGIDVGGLVDEVGNVNGIVVDARSNGGGDPYLAAELAGRFTSDAATAYAYYQTRIARDDDPYTYELTDPAPFTLRESAVSAVPFDGKVAVLLGANCASACENFAAMFDTVVPASRSFGATTRGASGWPDAYTLDDGKTVLYASTVFTTLADSGLPIEWCGVPPDQFTEFIGDGRDEVLEAATAWLMAD